MAHRSKQDFTPKRIPVACAGGRTGYGPMGPSGYRTTCGWGLLSRRTRTATSWDGQENPDTSRPCPRCGGEVREHPVRAMRRRFDATKVEYKKLVRG